MYVLTQQANSRLFINKRSNLEGVGADFQLRVQNAHDLKRENNVT